MKDEFQNSNWTLLKAYYNGTENEIPLQFPGKHYYLSRTASTAATGAWGVIMSSSAVRLFAPWGAMNNNIGEIAFLVNPNEVIFNGISF